MIAVVCVSRCYRVVVDGRMLFLLTRNVYVLDTVAAAVIVSVPVGTNVVGVASVGSTVIV
jgi:hypothetical protein